MATYDTDDENSTEEHVGPPVLPMVMTENSINEWKDSAAECVRTLIFPKQQFLVSDAALDMGGNVQRHVANFINISNVERIRKFWDEYGGRETVRNTFRKKRQAAQNSMKIAFRGKYIKKHHQSEITLLS